MDFYQENWEISKWFFLNDESIYINKFFSSLHWIKEMKKVAKFLFIGMKIAQIIVEYRRMMDIMEMMANANQM